MFRFYFDKKEEETQSCFYSTAYFRPPCLVELSSPFPQRNIPRKSIYRRESRDVMNAQCKEESPRKKDRYRVGNWEWNVCGENRGKNGGTAATTTTILLHFHSPASSQLLFPLFPLHGFLKREPGRSPIHHFHRWVLVLVEGEKGINLLPPTPPQIYIYKYEIATKYRSCFLPKNYIYCAPPPPETQTHAQLWTLPYLLKSGTPT